MLASDEARVDRILAIARDVLSKRDITADDELADHGGTSLSLVRIVAVTSRMLNLDINPRDLGGMVTVRNLARVATPTPADGELSSHDRELRTHPLT
jgi:acyl carrier protein